MTRQSVAASTLSVPFLCFGAGFYAGYDTIALKTHSLMLLSGRLSFLSIHNVSELPRDYGWWQKLMDRFQDELCVTVSHGRRRKHTQKDNSKGGENICQVCIYLQGAGNVAIWQSG